MVEVIISSLVMTPMNVILHIVVDSLTVSAAALHCHCTEADGASVIG